MSSPPGGKPARRPRRGTDTAGIATVKAAAPFPAAAIPRPPLSHAMGMLSDELSAMVALLQRLDPTAWQLPAVRDAAMRMILEAEEVARNRRLLGRLRRARLLPGAMTAVRRQHRAATLPEAAPEQLAAELGSWGHMAADAAPWLRGTAASRFLAGAPAGYSADYLFRVLLPRDAWLCRAEIAEAAGQDTAPGPHGAEIIRQAVRDLAGVWHGPAVTVEITGPAGGRWLTGDGAPAAAVRAGPAGFLRLVTARPDGTAEASGDPLVTSAFLAARIP
jgi:hypothetical protein